MNRIWAVLALLLWMPACYAQNLWLQLQSRHETIEAVEASLGDYRVPPVTPATAAVERGWNIVVVDASNKILYSRMIDDSRYRRGEVFDEVTGQIKRVKETFVAEGMEEVLLPFDSQVARVRIYRIDVDNASPPRGQQAARPVVDMDRQAIERLTKRASLRGVLGDIDSDKVVVLNPDGSTGRKPLVFAFVGDGYAREDMDAYREEVNAAIEIIMGDAVFAGIKEQVGFLRVDHVSPVSGQPDTAAIESMMKHSNQLGHGIYDVSIKLSKFTYHQHGVGGIASTNKIYIFKTTPGQPVALSAIPHEIGHALFGLTDEYPSYDPPQDCSPKDSLWPNVTRQTDRTKVPWADLIKPDTPVPTDENVAEAGAIGLYTIYKDCLYNPVPQGIMGGGRYGTKGYQAGWGAVNERHIRSVLQAYLGSALPLVFSPSVVMKIKTGEQRDYLGATVRDSGVPLILEAGSTSVPNPGAAAFSYRWTLPAELKPQVNGRYAMIVPPETPQFAQYPVQVEITDTKASNSRTETLTVFPKIRITGEIIGPSSVIGGTWLELTAATQHQGGNDPSFHYAWTLPSGWSQPIGNGTPTLRVLSPPVAVSTPGTFSVVVTPSVALPGTENNPYPDKRSIKADAVTLTTTVVARQREPVDIEPHAKIQGPSSIGVAQLFRLDGSGSEIPYSPTRMQYRWTAPGFAPVSSTVIAPQFKAPASPGDYPVTLTVTNSEHRSSVVTRTLRVQAGETPPEPERIEGPQTVTSGEVVTFRAIVNHPQDVRGYSWALPQGFGFDHGNAAQITPTVPTVTQNTGGRVGVLVYRTGSANPTSLAKDIVIQPKPGGAAPVAKITGATTVPVGEVLVMSAVGSSGDKLRYTWTANGFSPATYAGIGPIFTAPTTAGPRTLVLTVTDASNRSATASHTVNVTARPGSDCAPAWVAGKVYATPAEKVSYAGYNYEVAHWTQNDRPDLNYVLSGSAKPWRRLGTCTP